MTLRPIRVNTAKIIIQIQLLQVPDQLHVFYVGEHNSKWSSFALIPQAFWVSLDIAINTQLLGCAYLVAACQQYGAHKPQGYQPNKLAASNSVGGVCFNNRDIPKHHFKTWSPLLQLDILLLTSRSGHSAFTTFRTSVPESKGYSECLRQNLCNLSKSSCNLQ